MTPRHPVRAALVVVGLVALTSCSGGEDDPTLAAPTSAASSSSATAAEPLPSAGQWIAETVEAQLAGVPLRLEVADDERERAIGLMGRTSVPTGTGMVFRYAEPTRGSYYMFQVPVPLTAVFVRAGTVVFVAQMPPCGETDPHACPVYGPDEPFDTVVETAPETLPGVRPGDRLELR